MKTAKVRVGESWEPREFEQIKPGEHFRLFSAGEQIGGDLVALTAPEPCDPPGNYAIKAEKVAA